MPPTTLENCSRVSLNSSCLFSFTQHFPFILKVLVGSQDRTAHPHCSLHGFGQKLIGHSWTENTGNIRAVITSCYYSAHPYFHTMYLHGKYVQYIRMWFHYRSLLSLIQTRQQTQRQKIMYVLLDARSSQIDSSFWNLDLGEAVHQQTMPVHKVSTNSQYQALYYSTWFLLLEAVSYRVYRVKYT